MPLGRGVFEDLYCIFLYLAIYILSLLPFPVLPLFLIRGQNVVSWLCWRFPGLLCLSSHRRLCSSGPVSQNKPFLP